MGGVNQLTNSSLLFNSILHLQDSTTLLFGNHVFDCFPNATVEIRTCNINTLAFILRFRSNYPTRNDESSSNWFFVFWNLSIRDRECNQIEISVEFECTLEKYHISVWDCEHAFEDIVLNTSIRRQFFYSPTFFETFIPLGAFCSVF